MTRENRNHLQNIISDIVLKTELWDLYIHCGVCASFNSNSDYVGITKRSVAPYIAKRLGYAVRLDVIKHALISCGIQRGQIFIIQKAEG